MWWRQSYLMSWTWRAQFLAKVNPQGQADSWDNGVEKNMGQRNSVQIEINKMFPTPKPHYCVPNYCAPSGKPPVFLTRQHPQIWLLTICTSLLYFQLSCSCSKNRVLPPLRTLQWVSQDSKREGSKETRVAGLELWLLFCCVCVWFPQQGASRTTAVPSAYLCCVAFK